VSHTAAALVRFGAGPDAHWGGSDLDLTDLDDVDALVDALDDVVDRSALLVGEDATKAGSVVVLVEEDDEWLGVLRVDDRDVRVFLSDRRAVLTSEIAERFFADAAGVEIVEPDQLEDEEDVITSLEPGAELPDSERPEFEPGGDVDLLADLGTPAARLLALCSQEGVLPADVIAQLADTAGAGIVLEELRGG
jgi:putative tRNA adenosine deaminase-associated protein